MTGLKVQRSKVKVTRSRNLLTAKTSQDGNGRSNRLQSWLQFLLCFKVIRLCTGNRNMAALNDLFAGRFDIVAYYYCYCYYYYYYYYYRSEGNKVTSITTALRHVPAIRVRCSLREITQTYTTIN